MKTKVHAFIEKLKKQTWDYYVIPALEEFRVEEQRVEQMAENIFHRITMPQWATVRALSLNTTRVALFSLVIFAAGFLTINGQAYTDIMMDWLTQDLAKTQLQEVVEERIPREQELLVVERNAEAQKEQMPELGLEVMPPDNRLLIPKIDKDIPIIDTDPQKLIDADWQTLEQTFQEDLREGVVHYPGTANPGESGNVFITGHSSYYIWDPGRYKDVFARLNKLEVGDDIIVYYEQEKYHYVVRDKKEVKNDDVSVLQQEGDEHLLTLMTCSPVGTNFRRLVVTAEEV